ncbi:hypothetical protein BKA70DRAFT_1293456 [Coprinopsis sp. MPI-PUGE-AT-0042]|nr:hypothetical protein BKA70DRAFT_1293456 [Coprinopsis sp. MPI-PUGE-AT-0042]
MPQQTRWVVLDGTRDAGTYTTSGWISDFDKNSFMGTLYNGSRTKSSSAPFPSMSFPFDGTEFILFGKSDRSRDGDVPSWSCTVDGAFVKVDVVDNPGPFSCSWKGSGSNAHTFRLSIDSLGSVAIDSIWFLPTYNSTRVEKSYVVYNHDDPNVSRSGNWTTFSHEGKNATLTETVGSSLSLVFTGTGVYAEGWSPAGFPAGNSKADYSLGNGIISSPFDLEPPNPPSETIHGKKLFERTNLQSPGELKNLTITYKGPSAPLVLERFFVADGNFRIGDDPLAPEPTAGSSDSSSGGLNTIGNILKIAVPVVVGFFALVFIISCFTGCFGRRKKPSSSHQLDKEIELTQQPPYTYQPYNESGAHLMQGPYQPPPPPYQRPELSQSISGLSVGGGGAANIAGRDNNNITIHNLTVHPDVFNPPPRP